MEVSIQYVHSMFDAFIQEIFDIQITALDAAGSRSHLECPNVLFHSVSFDIYFLATVIWRFKADNRYMTISDLEENSVSSL